MRLANSALGEVTSPVQESIELAAGETRPLEGEFVPVASMDTDARTVAR